MERYAVVHNILPGSSVDPYLPSNYRVGAIESLPDGKTMALIFGEDVAGWTLDGYVIPRLASGMMFATEYETMFAAREALAAPMN